MCPKFRTRNSQENENWGNCGCFSTAGGCCAGKLLLQSYDLHFQFFMKISQQILQSLPSFLIQQQPFTYLLGRKKGTFTDSSQPIPPTVYCPDLCRLPCLLWPVLPLACLPRLTQHLLYTPCTLPDLGIPSWSTRHLFEIFRNCNRALSELTVAQYCFLFLDFCNYDARVFLISPLLSL